MPCRHLCTTTWTVRHLWVSGWPCTLSIQVRCTPNPNLTHTVGLLSHRASPHAFLDALLAARPPAGEALTLAVLDLLTDSHYGLLPSRAVVLPGGDDVPGPRLSSCFHLDSKGKACFTEEGAWLPSPVYFAATHIAAPLQSPGP